MKFTKQWFRQVALVAALGLTGYTMVDSGLSQSASAAQPSPVVLFTIGVHIEPLGITAQGYKGGRGDYGQHGMFERHAEDLRTLADLVEGHKGVMTVQAQSPFTTSAAQFNSTILGDLETRGHEIGLHFHEDAHLGQNPEQLSADAWCAVMNDEIGFIHAAGVVQPIRYWSGGNLYPGLLDAAACAGLDVNSDWKNPHSQQGNQELIGLNPWRPAGGPSETDVSAFATHDPNGPVVFVPSGLFDRTDFASGRRSTSDEDYFNFLGQSLQTTVEAAQTDRVNVFHITVHPGEFRGDAQHPFGVIDDFLTRYVDPLVAEGKVRWATLSQMSDAFVAWEQTHPGVDPRSSSSTVSDGVASSNAVPSPTQTGSCTAPGYASFVINIHDILHVDESADTLLHLTDLFEKYGVSGDFYLTAPMVHLYAEQRPDVIERLKNSAMTISYHVRPPFISYKNFDARLEGLSQAELVQTLRDYETYRLDLSTGDLLRDEAGGYSYVKAVFGRAPVVAGVPNLRWRDAGLPILAEMGAQMTVTYHETGTDPQQPFAWTQGLLQRPSDFSVTRWSVPGGPQEAFWWNELDTPYAAQYDPVARMQQLMGGWPEDRAPFATVLVHENNFYRQGGTPWTFVYYNDRNKTQPKAPPYDLDAPDASRPRSAENQDAIWSAYEALIAYSSEQLCVVTSADIVALAGSQVQ